MEVVSDNFAFGRDEVGGGDGGDTEGFGGGGSPVAAGPEVEGVGPAAGFEMFAGGGGIVINAEGDEFDTIGPGGIFGPGFLEFGHRLLAGAAPSGPEFEEDEFSAEIGEGFFEGGIFEGEELDSGRGRVRGEAAVSRDVVFVGLAGDLFFGEEGFWEIDPAHVLEIPAAIDAFGGSAAEDTIGGGDSCAGRGCDFGEG